MKKIFILLLVLLIPISCSLFEPIGQVHLKERILDGYSVKTLTFEEDGTAWCGVTRDQYGLIRYDIDGTIQIFDHSNSVLLDSVSIWDIEIDSQGKVWLSNDGLLCYDGVEFTRYDSANSMLISNFVRAIACDDNDKIWFSTRYQYDGSIMSFDGSSFRSYDPEELSGMAYFVRDIEIDNLNHVWFAIKSIQSNIVFLEYDGLNWTSYTEQDIGIDPYDISDIEFRSDNSLCFTNDYTYSSLYFEGLSSVYVFDGENTAVSLEDSVMCRYLCVDSKDHIWASGVFHDLQVYDGKEWHMINSGLISWSISALEESPLGDLWVATSTGIHIFNK